MENQNVIDAFHMMWDNFPEPVMLIKKSREIFTLNKAAAAAGLTPGSKCSHIGKPEQHKGCRCNEAADEQKPVYITYETSFGKAFGYWIPVAGHEEFIIHFGVGGNFEYESAVK